MRPWLIVAPTRDDDDTLQRTAWIATQHTRLAVEHPATLLGGAATRGGLERHVRDRGAPSGIAFFGHGAADRLFDADRPPGSSEPALLDAQNLHLVEGAWVHAFACLAGVRLGELAIDAGVQCFVGYNRALDAGWQIPPPAEEPFRALVTALTLALLQGVREERALRARVSEQADTFVAALEPLPDDTPGLMWLYALAQQLVDNMVVAQPRLTPPR